MQKPVYKWEEGELSAADNVWDSSVTSKTNVKKTPLEYFQLFFDTSVIQMIVKYTNQYTAKRNPTALGNVTEDEMMSFIAVLLLSGYVVLPRRNLYGQREPDTHNEHVSGALSRGKFDYIMRNFHSCNNDKLNKSDRFAKIRKLLDKLIERFKCHTPHHESHSVDESMVLYFGRHGAKHFIRGKFPSNTIIPLK